MQLSGSLVLVFMGTFRQALLDIIYSLDEFWLKRMQLTPSHTIRQRNTKHAQDIKRTIVELQNYPEVRNALISLSLPISLFLSLSPLTEWRTLSQLSSASICSRSCPAVSPAELIRKHNHSVPTLLGFPRFPVRITGAPGNLNTTDKLFSRYSFFFWHSVKLHAKTSYSIPHPFSSVQMNSSFRKLHMSNCHRSVWNNPLETCV